MEGLIASEVKAERTKLLFSLVTILFAYFYFIVNLKKI